MSIDALRAIQSLLPDAELIEFDAPMDEGYAGAYSEPPCIASADLVEGRRMRAYRIEGAPEVRFAGFLDGIQRAKIVCHQRGVPIIEGTVAAVIRVRVNRRLVTWGHRTPIVSRKLYMPLSLLSCGQCSEHGGMPIVDTSFDEKTGDLVNRHPAALRSVAFARIGRDREAAERELAELWCVGGSGDEPLLIDGGISGSGCVAAAPCAIGVIKSHTTLFADGEALDVVMSLRSGERSSVFAPRSQRRSPVISWYLRLHDPRGHDAMFGLVRIEASTGGDVASRAHDISRWVLAERTPNAMPDSRWDRMSYGIRDCEQFLRSIA